MVGQIPWSSHNSGRAFSNYQAEHPGYRDVNYEKKYGTKAYNIWVIEKVDDDYSDRWTTATGGGLALLRMI